MYFARFRRFVRTLRFRLTVWNLIVIVISALVTLLGVRHGVRRAILHEMDQILIEDLYELGFKLSDAGTAVADIRAAGQNRPSPATRQLLDDLDRKARGHERHGWFVELREEAGPLLWSSEGAPEGLPAEHRVVDLQPLAFPGYRVVQRHESLGGPVALVVRVGASTDFLQRDMIRIDRLVAWAVLCVLLVAPPIGYWLAGRATRPLAQLIHSASRLRPARLDERLPLRRTGDELDQLAGTINGLLDRLAHYVAQRRDFLANSAHELRSPVAAIRSMAEVALADQRKKDEYDQLLEEVIEECESLERLVNQLLVLGEAETVQLRPATERVNLSLLVERAGEMFQAAAETRGVTLHVDVQPEVLVEGHWHLLRQVANNLLDNALKFTPPQGTVRVKLERVATVARLVVEDTGMGISSDDLPRVFDRFFRGDRSRARDTTTRGTGLGLSICQSVVESHGGGISVTSQVGHGTVVTVELPAMQALPAGRLGKWTSGS